LSLALGKKEDLMTCEWCARLIAAPRDGAFRPATYELFRDERGRLVLGEEGEYLLSGEHLCKARCGGCGELVVLEGGVAFERMEPSALPVREEDLVGRRVPHWCARARSTIP
jgi:hypothetical protein